MPFANAVDSRVLLTRLRVVLAEPGGGQERLDRIVRLVADGRTDMTFSCPVDEVPRARAAIETCLLYTSPSPRDS